MKQSLGMITNTTALTNMC